MTLAIRLKAILPTLVVLIFSAIGLPPSLASGIPIEFKVIRDVDPSIGIAEIVEFPENSFGAVRQARVRSMYGERSLWLKINDLKSTDVLRLSPVLDDVTLFIRVIGSPAWNEFRVGDQIDQSVRNLLSPFMALPISQKADRSLVYVRVVQPTAVSINVKSWTNKDFIEMQTGDERLKLLLFGFVLATITYNVFVSALLRDPVFLLNALTIASLLVFSLYLSGYGVAYFWREWTGWSNSIFVASVYGAIVFAGAFLWQFLRSGSETLMSGWLIVYSPILATLVIILSPFLPFWAVQLGTIIAGALLLLSTLIFVCKRAWRGDPKARVLIFPLLFAVIPGFFLVTLEKVFSVGLVRYSDNILEITFCLEALLFSLALVARVRIGELATRAANENIMRLKYESSIKSVEAQDGERKRLAKELHDGVGQNFLSVVGTLKSLAANYSETKISSSLKGLVEVATASLDELRRISKDMHPSSVEHLGLKRAVELLFENLENSDQIETELDLQFNETYLTPKMELNVYRIFQECLSNVSRHADATCCRGEIVSNDGYLAAFVEDDGSGMKPDIETSKGLGLISIEERVAALNGSCRFTESARGGMKVEFRFPLTSEATQVKES